MTIHLPRKNVFKSNSSAKDLLHWRILKGKRKLLQPTNRDRGGGGAGRAVALPRFCLGRFFRAPDDMDNV